MTVLFTKELHSKEGFNVTFNALVEDCDPCELMEPKDAKKVYNALDNGSLVQYCAQIVISLHGVELGTNYLGNCIDSEYEGFLTSGYLSQSIKEALAEAKEKAANLSNALNEVL